MAIISINSFMGERPGIAPWNIDEKNATVSHNAMLRRTALEPWMGSRQVMTAGFDVYSIHLPTDTQGVVAEPLVFPNAASWTEAADPGASGFNHVIRWDQTGQQTPKWIELATGLQTNVSIPGPTVPLAATATAVGIGESPDDRAYTYTWVDKFGAESVPAPPTYVGQTYENSVFVLTGFAAPPVNAVRCRIYRTASVTPDSNAAINSDLKTTFQLVREVDLPITSYTDSAALIDIQWSTLLTADNGDIPAPFEQVVSTVGGHFIGFWQNQLWVSERHEPWNWPERQRYELPDRIKALAAHTYTIMRFGQALTHDVVFVGTTGRPYRLTVGMSRSGDRSETVAEPAPYMEHLPCLQKETMVAAEIGALYVSTEGLILLTPAGEAHRVTKGRIDEDRWLEHAPNIAAWHRGRYYGCRSPNGPGIVIDVTANDRQQPDLAGFSTIDLQATCLHSGRDGRLYYARGRDVFVWGEGNVPLTYNWRSKRFRFTNATAFGAARVLADYGGPVQFTLYSHGVPRYSVSVTNESVFRLPPLNRQTDWQIELTGSTIIRQVKVGHSAADLAVDKSPTQVAT